MLPSIAAILLTFNEAQHSAPKIQADLVESAKAMEAIEYCEESPAPDTLQRRYSKLGERYYAMLFRAGGLYGHRIDPSEAVALSEVRSVRRCEEREFAPAERRAKEALKRVEYRLVDAERWLARGLWFGLFPVCRQTIVNAEFRNLPTDRATLDIDFTIAAATAFRTYSSRFVEGVILSKDMTVTLDGAVEARVSVFEPISSVQLSGPPEAVLRAMHRAANSDCHAPIDVYVNGI
jgi:hypothetical protein